MSARLDDLRGGRENRGMTDDMLTVDYFAARVGETFRVAIEGREPYELELTAATGMPGDSDAREPFSVLFRSREDAVLPQRIYRLEHDRLEPLVLFLVPLGPDQETEGSLLYEAAFS